MKPKSEIEVTGALTILGRLPNSRYRNPRFLLDIGGVRCRTAPDSDIAYDVPNVEGQTVVATMRYYYGKPTLVDYKREEAANTTDRHVKLHP